MGSLGRFYRDYLLPIGILSGTIIGAGIFSLPFVFRAAGGTLGAFYLILAAGVYSYLHLMYADLFLRTPGEHRLVGYARLYLGRSGAWFSVALGVIQMMLVLTVYLILSERFWGLLMPARHAVVLGAAAFWLTGSAAIFLSTKRIASLELVGLAGIVSIIALIFILGLPRLRLPNGADVLSGQGAFFLPLAPILFSMAGRVAIPSVMTYLRTRGATALPRRARRVLTIGTFLPAAVYALFVLGVLGISPVPSEDAVSGLRGAVGSGTIGAIGILGLLTLWTSYIVIGLDIKNILRYDLRMGVLARSLLVVALPALLYFFAFHSFLDLVTLVGGVFLSAEGLLILAMWKRANALRPAPSLLLAQPNRFVFLAAAAVFLLALLHEAVSRLILPLI